MKIHTLSPINPAKNVGIGGRAVVVAQAGIRLAGKWSGSRLDELLDSLVDFKTSLATL